MVIRGGRAGCCFEEPVAFFAEVVDTGLLGMLDEEVEDGDAGVGSVRCCIDAEVQAGCIRGGLAGRYCQTVQE